MANNHMEKCSALVIREMQIKPINETHYAPIGVTRVKSDHFKC